MLNVSFMTTSICSNGDPIRESVLEIPQGVNTSVTCSVSGVWPRPVFTWEGAPGLQLLGRPECDVLLAQATVHLARAPKSHEVYSALTNVYEAIDNPGPGGLPDVPLHLRQGGGRVGKEQGWGVGYSFDLGKVKNIDYMPTQLKGQNFFRNPKNC